MTDDEIVELLRRALPKTPVKGPARELWPAVVERSHATPGWSWLDVGLAAVVVILLLLRPGWVWLLVYHL